MMVTSLSWFLVTSQMFSSRVKPVSQRKQISPLFEHSIQFLKVQGTRGEGRVVKCVCVWGGGGGGGGE